MNNVPLATLDSAAQNIIASAPVQGASVYFVVTATLPTTYADPYSLTLGLLHRRWRQRAAPEFRS